MGVDVSAGVRTTARQFVAVVLGLLVALLVLAPAAVADPSPSPSPTQEKEENDPCGAVWGPAKQYCERDNGGGGGGDGPSLDDPTSTLDPLSSLADGIAEGAAWVIDKLSDAVAATSDVDFTNDSFLKTYALVFAASTFLVLLIWLWAVAKRAVRGVPLTKALGEAVGLLWLSVLASAFTPLVLYTVVNSVDGITEALAGGSDHAKFFDAFSEALTENEDGGPFVKIVLSLVCMAAAGVLWIEMVIRAALLYVGAVLGTVVYAGLVDREMWSRVRRWVGIMTAVILVKPIVVIVLRLASALTNGEGPKDDVSAIVSGLSIILLAIIASALIFHMVPGMGDEIIAARRDSYDPASRQAAAIVTRPVSGIAQGINAHAGRDNSSRAPAQTSTPNVAHASNGIAAHSTRPASSPQVPPRPSVPPQDTRGSGT
ncbi:hypothetical protein [Streptomyces sp. enrichment culture]|uniref:hypothetical protein n=1 Tax=Streptomyces sp. enrichment culture TaxID=1795815 RepID=UPI003F549778